MLSPPTVWCQQSEFVSSRQSGQIPAAVRKGFECCCNVAISMDMHVGLNVATRVCDVYPHKCWFAVLCRFWLQCRRTLKINGPLQVCRVYTVLSMRYLFFGEVMHHRTLIPLEMRPLHCPSRNTK